MKAKRKLKKILKEAERLNNDVEELKGMISNGNIFIRHDSSYGTDHKGQPIVIKHLDNTSSILIDGEWHKIINQ